MPHPPAFNGLFTPRDPSFLTLFSLSGTYETQLSDTFCSNVHVQAAIAPGLANSETG